MLFFNQLYQNIHTHTHAYDNGLCDEIAIKFHSFYEDISFASADSLIFMWPMLLLSFRNKSTARVSVGSDRLWADKIAVDIYIYFVGLNINISLMKSKSHQFWEQLNWFVRSRCNLNSIKFNFFTAKRAEFHIRLIDIWYLVIHFNEWRMH